MQDRYAGDIGDFVKLGLLRAISPGQRLGVAWYRFPDEDHNRDGRHVSYLERPEGHAVLDPELLGHLRNVVKDARSIASLLPIIGTAASFDESLDVQGVPAHLRRNWRKAWFARALEKLADCNLVFADPDNGIVDDNDWRKGSAKFGKQMPLDEVRALARGRCAVTHLRRCHPRPAGPQRASPRIGRSFDAKVRQPRRKR